MANSQTNTFLDISGNGNDPQLVSCVEEYEAAFQSLIAPMVSDIGCLTAAQGVDYRPGCELSSRRFVDALNKCEQYFTQTKHRLMASNPELMLRLQCEELEAKIKSVDEAHAKVMEKLKRWKQIINNNRSLLTDEVAVNQLDPLDIFTPGSLPSISSLPSLSSLHLSPFTNPIKGSQ